MYAKLHTVLQERWVVLPVLSGVLLVLSFHPFNLWPLGFVALAPLYYFVAAYPRSRRQIFWGGAVTGGLFSFCLSYFTIIQFHWLPEAYLFVGAVRLAVLPITLLGAAVCGAAMLAYAKLRSPSLMQSVSVGAAVYALSEIILQAVFGGYYLATLGYVAVPLVPLLGVAALGGGALLSFAVAWVNVALAEAAIRGFKQVRDFVPLAACVAAAVVAVSVQAWYLRAAPQTQAITVSVIQGGLREGAQFGRVVNNAFSFPWLGEALASAASTTPDLVIYPFSPVEGALYRTHAPLNKNVLAASESQFGAFLNTHVPAQSAVLTWNTLYDGNFYNEYQVWRGGVPESEYQKRALFPFMDYTPAWAQRIGLYSTPFDVVAGASDDLPMLGDIPLGSLLCSELHSAALARSDARRSPLLIAVGSEAMFVDEVASNFSLKAAQLRAAENNVPVVRGNILGPSAIIARDGSLIAYAPARLEAIVSATVPLYEPRATLYNRFGPLPTLLLICGILGTALWRRLHSYLPADR